MRVSHSVPTRTPLPPALGLVAGAGSAAALFATYWDDAWHTDRGRDEFAIPPHLLLYGGVLVGLLVVTLWAFRAWGAVGGGAAGVRALVGDGGLRLGTIGAVTTLLSAPIDEAWHRAFGRDAVVWSPPHLAAVAGTLALSVGLLAGLRSSRGPGASLARLVAAAGVIGTLQVPALEYDSDVPQFSVLWYLPVAALGICIAALILEDLLPRASDLVWAAAIYTVLRVVVVGALAAMGFSLTVVPPVVVVFVIAAATRPWRRWRRVLVVGAATPLLWWPVVHLQGEAAAVPSDDLFVVVLMTVAVSALVAIADRLRMPPRLLRLTAVPIVAAALLAVPAEPAVAHDPGQGPEVREAWLTVTRVEAEAQVAMRIDGPCDGLVPRRTVARRAGVTRQGPLRLERDLGQTCALTGAVEGLGDGRWFVYAELRSAAGERLESWLPVADDGTFGARRALYAPPTQSGGLPKLVVTALLLVLVAALVVACMRVGQRSGDVSASVSPTS